MGVRNVQLGVSCTRVMDGWKLWPGFEDDSPAADTARKAFGARIMEEDRAQYLTVGIQLGERYENSPIVCADGTPATPDSWDTYTPMARPGARAPHFWLAKGHAAYDDFGPGFTLLDFGAPGDAAAIEEAARSRGVPLRDSAAGTTRRPLSQQPRAGPAGSTHCLAWRRRERSTLGNRPRARRIGPRERRFPALSGYFHRNGRTLDTSAENSHIAGVTGAIEMAEERMERRLAAILAADIAGYSALMGADEARTVRDLKGHQAVVLPMIGEFAGRIIDTAGRRHSRRVRQRRERGRMRGRHPDRDGGAQRRGRARRAACSSASASISATSSTTTSASMATASTWRRGWRASRRPAASASRARSTTKSTAGSIVACQDLGEQQLKNIARPVRVYRIRLDGASPAAPPAPALPDKPSIAVLPFQNMSGDPEQEYFADGITEDLITDLSKISGLFVIARNSSFAYKGRSVKVQEIGARPRRALRARGQHPQGRQPRAHHRAAHRCRQRRASLGRALRPRSHRHLRDAGRGGREDRRRAGGHADAGRGAAAAPARHRERRGLRNLAARDASCSCRGTREVGRAGQRDVPPGDRARSEFRRRRMPAWRSPALRTTSATGRPIRSRRWTRRSDGRAARSN